VTRGGRGGRLIPVTNLNASGSGSLQAACEAEGPRIVVFKVAGTIDGNVRIRNDHITIAGQTAPGDGVTIKGHLGIGANDVIVRNIRVRVFGINEVFPADQLQFQNPDRHPDFQSWTCRHTKPGTMCCIRPR
jgi:hypothetical protein